MKTHYFDIWKLNLSHSKKLKLYESIKTNYQREEYLDTIRNYEQRRILTKFRISNHNLAIETGRHGKRKIESDQRLCIFCNSNEIETEDHMLLHCPCYSGLRQHFLNKISTEIKIKTTNTTLKVMSSSSPLVTFYVSKYLLKCFELAASLIQNPTKQ